MRLFTVFFMFLGSLLEHLGVPFLPAMGLCFVLAFSWGMFLTWSPAVSSDAIAARKIHAWLHAGDR